MAARKRSSGTPNVPSAPAQPEPQSQAKETPTVETTTPAIVPASGDVSFQRILDTVIADPLEGDAGNRFSITPTTRVNITRVKDGVARITVKDGDETRGANIARSDETLDDLENTVRKGLAGLVEAGIALLEIRTFKLYAQRTDPKTGKAYKDFGPYAVATFNLSRPRVYQLVDIAQVAAILTNNGRQLPGTGKALSNLARLKDDPQAVVEAADEAAIETREAMLANGTPAGDLEGQTPIDPDAAQRAADRRGGGTAAGRSRRASGGPGGGNNPTRRRSAGGGPRTEEAPRNPDTDGTQDASGTPTTTVVALDPGKQSDDLVSNVLKPVIYALSTGRYDHKHDATVNAMQKLAGAAIAWLAGKWDGEAGHAARLLVTKTLAKDVAKRAPVDPDVAKQARINAEADEIDARNKANTGKAKTPKATATEVTEVPASEPPVAPATFNPNPTTAAEAYAIIDIDRAWKSDGNVGRSPVAGTVLRRANAWLDANTADDDQAAIDEAGPEPEESDDEAEGDDLNVSVEEEPTAPAPEPAPAPVPAPAPRRARPAGRRRTATAARRRR